MQSANTDYSFLTASRCRRGCFTWRYVWFGLLEASPEQERSLCTPGIEISKAVPRDSKRGKEKRKEEIRGRKIPRVKEGKKRGVYAETFVQPDHRAAFTTIFIMILDTFDPPTGNGLQWNNPTNSNPPGKADTLSETAFQTARREACEEIGLPNINQPLPPPFSVEHLCELPANLAKTELVVRPCVALLHSFDPATGANADPETELIPRLDAREVAAVFTARFDDFLRLRNGEGRGEGDWYRGSWSLWHNSNWRSKLIFHFSFSLFVLS